MADGKTPDPFIVEPVPGKMSYPAVVYGGSILLVSAVVSFPAQIDAVDAFSEFPAVETHPGYRAAESSRYVYQKSRVRIVENEH